VWSQLLYRTMTILNVAMYKLGNEAGVTYSNCLGLWSHDSISPSFSVYTEPTIVLCKS